MEPIDDELERRLAGRTAPSPGPELRTRVLAAVRSELARGAAAAQRRPWSFAAAAAALAFTWANLSLSAASVTRPLAPERPRAAADLRAEAARLRALLPELSERDALREAWLSRAGDGAVPLPRVESGSPGSRNDSKE